jgi:hypothetical protein
MVMTEGAEICSAEPGLRWWIKVKYPEVVEVRHQGQTVDDSKKEVAIGSNVHIATDGEGIAIGYAASIGAATYGIAIVERKIVNSSLYGKFGLGKDVP